MGLVLMERKVHATANDVPARLSQRMSLQASAVCKSQKKGATAAQSMLRHSRLLQGIIEYTGSTETI